MRRVHIVLLCATVALGAIAAISIITARRYSPCRAREGMRDNLFLNTAQYYCLAAVLRDLKARDPKLANPFGMEAVSEIGIMDPSFAEIFDDKGMLAKDKLAATVRLMTGELSVELPPYTKMVSVPAYADLRF
jgi:hypothetical protein